MHLARYINDLLYRYECVIVPGFGAFITHYKPAKLDEKTQFFSPPGKTVMFNRQLQTNDGILATYIADVEQCSYDLALMRIRNFTSDISDKLRKKEVVRFEEIGSFKINEELKIEFSPSNSNNLSTASFGLAPVYSAQVVRETAKVRELATSTASIKEQKSNVASSKPYLKYAAIGLIAIALSGFAGMKLYEQQVKEYNYASKKEAEHLIENQIQQATFSIGNPLPPVNVTIPKQNGKYHIVAGAFRVEDNAVKKIEQLTAKGYEPKRIGVNRFGLHQVIYSSYVDRKEALQNLRQIKRFENADAWLLVKDLSK